MRNVAQDAVMKSLTALPAADLAGAIRDGAASAVEVVEAHLVRIDELNGALNAFVQVIPERALAEARAADAEQARKEPLGPLHGVPFTAKDNLETAGVVTAIGVRERAHVVPDHDAQVVARMRRAGAILLGKTNCPPWGGGLETVNELYGRTSNPHDQSRTPGGSSGGEAAAIAAGLSPCGLGSDSGGSLRLPAHFCGIACLKPTAGLVPLTGCLDDDGPVGALSDPRTQIGPLARTADDLALLLSVIAGPDPLEPDVPPVHPRDARRVDLRGLRAAYHVENGLVPPTADTAAAVLTAAEALAAAGLHVEEQPLPGGGHALTGAIWRSYGGKLTSADLYRVFRRWDVYRRDLAAFFAPFDLLLCPVYPCAAVPHGGTSAPGLADGVSYTTPFSLTGWPVAVVRVGTSPEGLPIGIQLVARAWHDHVAIAAASEVQQAVGPFPPPPL